MDNEKIDSSRKGRATAGYILLLVGALLMISAVVMAIARAYLRLKLPVVIFASGLVVFVIGAIIMPRDKYGI